VSSLLLIVFVGWENCQGVQLEQAVKSRISILNALINKTENGHKGLQLEKTVPWKSNIIPYRFSPNITNETERLVSTVFDDLMNRTCIQLIPWTSEEYLTVIDAGSSCAASVGMQGRKQSMFLAPGCLTKTNISQQMLHILGFHREINRPDRDNYVEINWKNIRPEFSRSMNKYDKAAFLDMELDFDFESASNCQDSRIAIDSAVWITRAKNGTNRSLCNGDGFSSQDILKINRIYCSEHQNRINVTQTIANQSDTARNKS